MSTTFDVETSIRTISFKQRACFGALSHCVSDTRLGDIQKVVYYPFRIIDFGVQRIRPEDYNTTENTAKFWWEYLMSKKFFSEHILNKSEDFLLNGIHVSCNMPADRLLVTLFMFRYAQECSGVIIDFVDLVRNQKIDPDIAFILAFLINNKYQKLDISKGYNKTKKKFTIKVDYCPESTMIPSKSLSIKDTKSILNNLLSDNYDRELFSGVQDKFSIARTYHRKGEEHKQALCRYFSQRRAAMPTTNLLKAVLIHIKPGILGNENLGNPNYLGNQSLSMTLNQMKKAAEFIQKLKR